MSVPNDVVARWLANNKIFSEAQLRQDWQVIQPTKTGDFMLGLVRLGRLNNTQAHEYFAEMQRQYSGETAVSSDSLDNSLDKSQNVSVAANASVVMSASASVATPVSDEPANPDQINASDSELKVANYAVQAELSRGGMGIVYRAHCLRSGQLVALKVINQAISSIVNVKRFEYEARALQGLNHLNIVGLHDFGDLDGKRFLALEFVKGQSLKDFILDGLKAHKKPDWNRLIDICQQILDGLEHCHERGLLHRDLKPENVLIEDITGRVVIVDFGLVRKQENQANDISLTGGLTVEGQTIGTPAFMAPEQIDSEKTEISDKTDVWGFGATLYFLLTGRSPFGKLSVVQLYKALLTSTPLPPSSIDSEIPEALNEACVRCLVKDQKSRPSLEELRALIKPKSESQSSSRKRKFAYIAAGFAAIVALIAFATVMFRRPAKFAPTLQLTQDELSEKCQGRKAGRFSYEIPLNFDSESSDSLNVIFKASNNGQELNSAAKLLDSGELQFAVRLKDGVNELEFRVSHGVHSTVLKRLAVIDNFAPQLAKNSWISETFDRKVKLTLQADVNPDPSIKTREEIRAIAFRDEQEIGKTEAFAATNTIELDVIQGKNKVELFIYDRAGNLSKVTHTIVRHPTIVIGQPGALAADLEAIKSFGNFAEAQKWLKSVDSARTWNSIQIALSPGRYEEVKFASRYKYAKLLGLGDAGAVVFFANSETALAIEPPLSKDFGSGIVEINNLQFDGFSRGVNKETVGDSKVHDGVGAAPGAPACKIVATNAVVRNCRFVSDHSIGLSVSGSVTFAKKPAIKTLTFVDSCDFATGDFGSLYMHTYGNAYVKNCDFRRPSPKSELGAAIYCVHDSQTQLENCTIEDMPAAGMKVTEGAQVSLIDSAIRKCVGVGVMLYSFGSLAHLEKVRLESILQHPKLVDADAVKRFRHSDAAISVGNRATAQLTGVVIQDCETSGIVLGVGGFAKIRDSQIINNVGCGLRVRTARRPHPKDQHKRVFAALENVKIAGNRFVSVCLPIGFIQAASDCNIEPSAQTMIPEHKQLERAREMLSVAPKLLATSLEIQRPFEHKVPQMMPFVIDVESQ